MLRVLLSLLLRRLRRRHPKLFDSETVAASVAAAIEEIWGEYQAQVSAFAAQEIDLELPRAA